MSVSGHDEARNRPKGLYAWVVIPLVLAISLTVPLGPGSERIARDLAAPDVLGESLEGFEVLLWGIAVEPGGIRYTLKVAQGDAETTVWVDAATYDVRSDGHIVPALAEAAVAFAQRLQSKLPARAPPTTAEVTSKPVVTPQQLTPSWVSFAMLILWGLAMFVTLPQLRPILRETRALHWVALVLICSASAYLLYGSPDVIAHHHGHGFDTARAISGYTSTLFGQHQPFGSLATTWASFLGAGDVFMASRLSALLCLPTLFALVLALGGLPRAAILATGLLATQPALLYMGRAETTTTHGLLIVLLASVWCAASVRLRKAGVFGAAIIALCVLGHFRLLGPVALGPVALLLVLPWASTGRLPVGWVIAGAALTALFVSPHAWDVSQVLSTPATSHAAASSAHLPTTLLESSAWTAPAFFFIFSVALLHQLWRSTWLGLWLSVTTLALLFAPIGAAHVWSAWPRYQLWAFIPAAIAVSMSMSDLVTWRPRLGGLTVVGGLCMLGWGSTLPAQSLTLEHPEDIQLRAWREGIKRLPADATVVVPTRAAGQARPSLPDHELARLRPDLHLTSLDSVDPSLTSNTFWFEPLYCHAQYPDTERVPGNPCDAVRRGFDLRPAYVWGAMTVIPEPFVDDGLPLQWHLIPYPLPIVRVGFFTLNAR